MEEEEGGRGGADGRTVQEETLQEDAVKDAVGVEGAEGEVVARCLLQRCADIILQGYLTYKKTQPLTTLPEVYA